MAKSKFAIPLLLFLILLGSNLFATPAVTAPDEVKWSPEDIPDEGEAGNWVLADGSDVQYLAMANDGTLYASVTGLSYTLYKSTDGGYNWSYTGNVTEVIVALATADNGSVIYYATSANIYKSTDAGDSFRPLAARPGGAGINNIEITSIDIALWGNSNIIVVGTKDSDAGEYGGVYVLDEEQLFPSWRDTEIDSFDVYAVAFSPEFARDEQIVAVVTDETDSFVTTKIGTAGWGKTIGDARLDKDNSGAPVAVSISADIVFPDDYSCDGTAGAYVQFVAINAGGDDGDVYEIYGVEAPGSSEAIDLDVGSSYGLNNIDFTSLAISGNVATCHLLAGAAASSQVYRSSDGGANWTRSSKEPTGQSKTYVLMPPDFSDCSEAYAVTSGSESAFSITQDSGVTWNQLGLIDTEISNIIDLAFSPNYSQDNALFMLTWGGEFCLWRSLSGGAIWQKVFSSTLAGIDSLDLVQLSPQYGNGSQVIFLAGSGDGSPAIWSSADDGQSFSRRDTPFPVDQWAVASDTTLFIASYDGINGLVYKTTNSGRSYSTGVVAGNQSLSSIALSLNYDRDGIILVGNSNGWIYWSNDKGSSFEPLPWDATSPPLTGNISVAFDSQFSSNNTVYAASDTPDGGIYRFVIGTSASWQSIDSTLPAGGMVGKLDVSADGVLYATNFRQVDTVNEEGGMERCLNPTLGATFETVTRGLGDGATLFGLWLCASQIWSIDTTNIKLMTYRDSLTQPVVLTSPDNRAPGIGTIINGTIDDVSLDWEPLKGATSYQWQLDNDNNFSSIPDGFEGNTSSTSVRLPVLQPATSYYWRVRAAEPVLSPWSAKWSFTTSLGGEIVAPRLLSPQPGASGVPVRPVFQWSVVTGAEAYELVVSIHLNFDNPSILKVGEYALPGNAWQPDIGLAYLTTYYWKVRAISSSSSSAWSAVGAFTTELEPTVVVEPPPTTIIPTLEVTEVPPEVIVVPPPTIIIPTLKVTKVHPEVIVVPPPETTMELSVVTAELTTLSPLLSPPTQQSSTPPDWVYYLTGLMGLIVVLLLVTILVLVVRRH